MNKKISYTIISLLILVVVILSCVCFKKHNEAQKYQEEIASGNFSDWSTLFYVTRSVDNRLVQNPEWEEDTALHSWVSGHLFDRNPIPQISGVSTETFRFLGVWYEPVLAELTSDRIPDMYKEELFQIFCEMNTELRNICSYVMDTCLGDTEKQEELITEDSDLYKKVSKDLEAFCRKYAKKCGDYFKRFDFK